MVPALLPFVAGGVLLGTGGCVCRTRPLATVPEAPARAAEMNRSLLGGGGPPRLVVRVDWIEGAEPEGYALRELRRWLVRETGRPREAIEVVRGAEVTRAERPDTRDAIADTILANAAPPDRHEAHFVYVLYWDRWKKYRGVYFPRGALDRRVRHEAVVMFVEPIEAQSVLWLTRRKVEAAVLVHEFGHGAGLVTSGAHGRDGHCTNPWCRMYWGVDGASLRSNLVPVLCRGVLPVDFCEQCEADLAEGRRPAEASQE